MIKIKKDLLHTLMYLLKIIEFTFKIMIYIILFNKDLNSKIVNK